MAISALTAWIGGLVAAGGIGASTHAASKASTQRKKSADAQADAQRQATEALLAAPDKAAAKAKEDALNRRRYRAKTLLTSPSGVLDEATTEKKTLLGA